MKSITKYLLVSLFLVIGCSSNSNKPSLTTQSEVGASTDEGMNALVSTLDSLSGEEGELQAGASSERSLIVVVPSARPNLCRERVVEAACNNGIRRVEYSNCRERASGKIVDGFYQLQYSNAACTLDAVGESVKSSKDIKISGAGAFEEHRFTTDATDYRGKTIGGGAELKKTEGGFEVKILGVNRETVRPNGEKAADLSVRTLKNLIFEGQLRRKDRHLIDGTIEINHNAKGFTAAYSANNLSWTSDCCYPISGSFSAVFEGSVQGTGSVEFKSCGKVVVTRNGTSEEVTLRSCE